MNPQESLLNWYLLNKRDLSFRKSKKAYFIWISEVMLQQTRVAAMLPLYESFVQKFPNIESLANAAEEEVLSAWKGLGYYTRARNLRKAAIYLVQNYNGKFPKDLAQVLKVPGIGPYTARAILSIAYDLPFAVLDGNVKRVLSRFYFFEKNILSSKSNEELQTFADSFLNFQSPGDHNQAVMELGANICLPENPKCNQCPIQKNCKSFLLGKTKEIPIRVKTERKIDLAGKIFCIFSSEKILLIQEQNVRFLKGMFYLPYGFFEENVSIEYSPSPFLVSLGNLKGLFPKGNFRHSITHHKLLMEVVSVHLEPKILRLETFPDLNFKWVPLDRLEEEFPSSLATKTKKILLSSL